MDKIFEIMTEVKGNQVEVLKIPTRQSTAVFQAEHHLQADGSLYRKGIGTLCALPEKTEKQRQPIRLIIVKEVYR